MTSLASADSSVRKGLQRHDTKTILRKLPNEAAGTQRSWLRCIIIGFEILINMLNSCVTMATNIIYRCVIFKWFDRKSATIRIAGG